MLTDELDQTRNMLQHLQDSLIEDDKSQLEVVNCISLRDLCIYLCIYCYLAATYYRK